MTVKRKRGRPRLGKKLVSLKLSPLANYFLSQKAKGAGLTRSEIVERMIFLSARFNFRK